MENKFYEGLLKLDLQRFGDEGQSEGGDENSGTQNNVEGDSSNEEQRFKTFSSQSELDSFVDKKIAKALDTAHSNWEKEQNDKAQKAKNLKNMSPEERQEYDLKQREKALIDREAEVTKRENKSKLATQLVTDGLPAELVDVFDDVLADEDKMTNTYQKVSDVFRSAVHDAVEIRLAQSAKPLKISDNTQTNKTTGEIFAERANESQNVKNDFWN